LLGGAEALAVPAERADGVQRIHVALERYPNLFAPPHWNETVISGQ
ncbi:MAG TPA: DnrO protein, partial [Pseudomonas sp.]|nr:DnrO protein [Pseudomonas sp.]